jgi:hypothetical protein
LADVGTEPAAEEVEIDLSLRQSAPTFGSPSVIKQATYRLARRMGNETKAILDWSVAQFEKAMPELRGLEPAESQEAASMDL